LREGSIKVTVLLSFTQETRIFLPLCPLPQNKYFYLPDSGSHVRTSPNQGLFLPREGKGKEPGNEDVRQPPDPKPLRRRVLIFTLYLSSSTSTMWGACSVLLRMRSYEL
jgi:hypothetical protein